VDPRLVEPNSLVDAFEFVSALSLDLSTEDERIHVPLGF
jgi:hypothetical protein